MIVCPSIADVQRATAAHFGFPMQYLLGERRRRDIVHARWIGMYLARELTLASGAKIARAFNRDHTTFRHGCEQVEKHKVAAGDLECIKSQISREPKAGLLAWLA